MKKLMMLAALLAMVLVAAAPALAQGNAPSVDLGDDNSSVQYGDEATASGGDQSQNAVNQCEQILDQAVEQDNTVSGDQNANATGTGEGDTGAAAGNGQNNEVSAEQAQYCINLLQGVAADEGSIAAGGDIEDAEVDGVDNDEDGEVDEGDGSEASAAAAAAAAAASSSSGSGGSSAGAAAGAAAGSSAGSGGSSGGSAGSTGVLPATGGVSLLTLGAGALLVAGGLVARRIVR